MEKGFLYSSKIILHPPVPFVIILSALNEKRLFNVYSFQLTQHTNIKYRDSLDRLGCNELTAMLIALGIHAPVHIEKLGGASFMMFDSHPLTEEQLRFLSAHSAVPFMAEMQEGLLRPLSRPDLNYLPEDLPEILKYKGKTSVTFTRCMINVALSASAFSSAKEPLTVLDPVYGKGTTAFCALQRGMNAAGVDVDIPALKESVDYFERYLKYHGLKHTLRKASETVGKSAVPLSSFTFAPTKEEWQAKDTRSLTVYQADTSLTERLFRKKPVHLIVADLPYGIQHAPVSGSAPESFTSLLNRVLPSWYNALLPGGAIAVSFNTLTLPTAKVQSCLTGAGFTVCDGPGYTGYRHEVEQAVVRDAVFAVKPSDPVVHK